MEAEEKELQMNLDLWDLQAEKIKAQADREAEVIVAKGIKKLKILKVLAMLNLQKFMERLFERPKFLCIL